MRCATTLKLVSLALWAGFVGCVGGPERRSPPLPVQRDPSPSQTAQSPAISGFTAFMRVELQPRLGAVPRDILPDEPMYSGDRFRVQTWTTASVYVYLISYDPKEWSTLEYPPGVHVQQPANEPLTIPGRGAWFKLNDHSGDGELVLFVSRRPLDQATAGRLRLPWPLWSADGTRGGNDSKKTEKDPPPPAKPPPPPPPPAVRPPWTRDGEWTIDHSTRIVSAMSRDGETAEIHFTYKHQP